MIEGILREGDVEATIGPDGWRCENAELQKYLATVYAPPSTEAGTPWVIAFWRAVEGLKAEVVQEPEPDPWPPKEEAGAE